MKFIKSFFTIAISGAMLTTSCTSENIEQTQESFDKEDLSLAFQQSLAKNADPISFFKDINKNLEGYKIAQVEFYTVVTSPEDKDAITVLPIPDASSDEYRTGFRFFPNDSRRDSRKNLTYVTVSEFATSANGVASEQIFDDMYDVWENESHCNNVSIDKQPFDFTTQGLPSTILSFGGIPLGPVADHNIIGYIPAFLFQAIGAPPTTLAVTFSFGFRDEDGNFTDLNNDGKIDMSHTEIWFNDSVNWSTDGLAPGTTDVASVALHEFGHSVGLDHSGVLLASFDENGVNVDLQYAPTNVMNPAYIGNPKTDLAGDDNSIYCENFSAWPWW